MALSIGAAGCLTPADPGPGPSTPSEPTDAARATARWTAADCTGVSLVWTPSLDALDGAVGPWTPAEGPLPGRGVFVLFAFECPDTLIDGNATGPVSGGAAIVPIETPDRTHGIEADGWAALPEHVGDPAVAELFDDHGFAVPDGEASVTVDATAAGRRARMTYATSNGTVAADGVVDAQAEARDLDNALVADHAEPFSVFHGPESMERRSGQAVVEASGETWVSRLDLEPVPFRLAVDTAFGWDFTFELNARRGAG